MSAADGYNAPPLDRDDSVPPLRFGVPLDARSVNDAAYRNTYRSQLAPQTVAAQLAKYAAKAASAPSVKLIHS